MNHFDLIRCDFSNASMVREHFHADYELIYTLKGAIVLTENI